MLSVQLENIFTLLPTHTMQADQTVENADTDSFLLAEIALQQQRVLRVDYTTTNTVLTPASDNRVTKFIVQYVNGRHVMKVPSSIDVVRGIRCSIPFYLEVHGQRTPSNMCLPWKSNSVIVFDMPEVVPTQFDLHLDLSKISYPMFLLLNSTQYEICFGGHRYLPGECVTSELDLPRRLPDNLRNMMATLLPHVNVDDM